MISSQESTAYHLTPRGWFTGSRQLKDEPLFFRPPPLDQVLSLVYRVTTTTDGYKHRRIQEVWRSRDSANVTGLLARFGQAPAEL